MALKTVRMYQKKKKKSDLKVSGNVNEMGKELANSDEVTSFIALFLHLRKPLSSFAREEKKGWKRT